MTEPRIGEEAVEKLGYLASLWIEEKGETKKRKRQAVHQYFTVSDIEGLGGKGSTNDDEVKEVNGDGTDQQTEGTSLPSLPWIADERGT